MIDCQERKSERPEQLLERQAYLQKIPLKGVFELTARCNFSCRMCYVHLKEEEIARIGRELSSEEWLSIARQARDAGMLYLTLTGGEVFARPGFRELYEELAGMGFLLQILTNGYGIDENVMAWLREMPPFTLRFTLYGASNETYARVCGVHDGFDRVSRAVDLVKEAGIPFFMVSTLVKENIGDLDAMQKFADEKQVPISFTTSVVKPVRGASQDAAAHRIDWITGHKEHLEQMLSRGEDRLFSPVDHPLDVCGSYRKGFWITWNGNLQLCSFMSAPAVPLTDGRSFAEAWEMLLAQLEKMRKPEECGSCPHEGFCARCPGILSAECGGCSQTAPEFCGYARRIHEEYLNMRKSK